MAPWYSMGVDVGTTTSTTLVWQNWTYTTDTSITTSTTSASTVWMNWSGTTASSCTVDVSITWHEWSLSTEQKTEIAKQQRENQEKWAREAAERKRRELRVARKAEALILALLSPAARKTWRKAGILEFQTEKRRYLVDPENGQMYVIDKEGKAIERWCVHAPSHFPKGDRAAAALLALQADEDAVHRTANRHAATEGDRQHVAQKIRLLRAA